LKLRRPSHATVVAYLALLTALGGSAYAVSKIGTRDLREGAVTSSKIKNGNVRGVDLATAVVRTKRRAFDAAVVGARVQARCKRNERLLSGGGGWDNAAGTVRFAAPSSNRLGGRVREYFVFGDSTAPNGLEVDVVCLPK
jgi:hypothetical protein